MPLGLVLACSLGGGCLVAGISGGEGGLLLGGRQAHRDLDPVPCVHLWQLDSGMARSLLFLFTPWLSTTLTWGRHGLLQGPNGLRSFVYCRGCGML